MSEQNNETPSESSQSGDIVISPSDLEIHTWPPRKTGGMTTGTILRGVLVHHKPTGIMISSDEHRHQYQNKDSAMSKLKAILKKLKAK